MSIIHEALKKVQKSLSNRTNETPTINPIDAVQHIKNVYDDTPVETIRPQPPAQPSKLSTIANIIKSFLAFMCALAITFGCCWFLYQQFKNNIYQAQRVVTKTFYKIMKTQAPPDFKTQRPEDLKPLAEIVVTPPVTNANTSTSTKVGTNAAAKVGANPTTIPSANGNTSTTMALPAVKTTPGVTLNIHGIMSNPTGNVALINDQVYQEGDSVDGAKIIKIDWNAITVIINGATQTIHVKN